jgi:predicted alpha-1,2-mannosidase
MTKFSTINRAFLFASLLVFAACGSNESAEEEPETGKDNTAETKPADPKASMDLVENPVKLVNTFIGTGGHGHTFPGVTVPFGMVQLSPDTRLDGWDGCSGYHYSDSIIYGFSHTHLSGTGVSDYGDILLMPYRSEHPVSYSELRERKVTPSVFPKSSESAEPGFYRVHLKDHNVHVQLTATERVGVHEYEFNKTGQNWILLDLNHRDKVTDFDINIENDRTISGKRISEAWAVEQHVYFVMEFSEPFESVTPAKRKEETLDENLKDYYRTLKFKDGQQKVLVRVGISAVSVEGARKNLEAEVQKNVVFQEVRNKAQNKWNTALKKIQVAGGTEKQQAIFYSALYHTMIAPNLFMDVDGQYRGTDLKIHKAEGFSNYTIFSLWDTFRGAHPLYTIIEQDRTNDFINTFLAQYEHGGQLPVWELAGNYTGCMIGYHSVPVITDAYMKGIRGYDAEKALTAMKHSAEQDHLGLASYKQYGYIPSGDEAESVSKTLEYAYDDWCIGTLAKELSHEVDFRHYTQRGQYYQNIFDPITGFARARLNGAWVSPFDPTEVNFSFTEANSWQYSLFAPQDISGLVDLLGGKDGMDQKLDALFTASSETSGRDQADITGLIGQYAHGNEPSHHMAYLYNYINKPWKTQQRVRQIMDELYTDQPDGLSGNEDCGQMSAWYVLSAMGFYSVTPGLDYYTIGTPIFDKVVINLENGNQFEINANEVSNQNTYIQSAQLNGDNHTQTYLNHEAIMAGGKLDFEMGAQPNKNWGNTDDDIPYSKIDLDIVPVPYFENSSRTFTDSMEVIIRSLWPNSDIELKLLRKGKRNAVISEELMYDKPFYITETTVILATVLSPNKNLEQPNSKTIRAEFIKIKGGRSITLNTKYENQYAAGGDNALIDYQHGSTNFRVGSWQGYQGNDLEAIVDLGETEPINRIALGCLQDIKSWIWYPTEIEFSISTDGKTYQSVAILKSDFSDREYGAFTKSFEKTLPGTEARYVKVTAKNYGECPDWHLGAGGTTWLFVDEIVIE